MKVYEIIFSPTGGTKKVADIITNKLCKDSSLIDLTDSNFDFGAVSFEKEDICVVSVPSYAGRVPQTATERLCQMKGAGAKCILTIVYGNRAYEDTMFELKDIMTEAGFQPIAAIAALAEHSIMHQFATGRPDEADCKELEAYVEKIQDKLKQEVSLEELIVPGNKPYKPYHCVPMKPETSKACTDCGACVTACPVGAISEDTKELDEESCISCMRCIGVCPANARAIRKEALEALVQRVQAACQGRKENELFL